MTTERFVVCFYQQLTSVQNCPGWHWCSTSHIQAAFKQGWNGIWFKNPLRIVYRKKISIARFPNHCCREPIPNRKIRTKTKQQKQKMCSFLTAEVVPAWSLFTSVHHQLEIHSCQKSFQNIYKCRNFSSWSIYTYWTMMIKHNKLPL